MRRGRGYSRRQPQAKKPFWVLSEARWTPTGSPTEGEDSQSSLRAASRSQQLEYQLRLAIGALRRAVELSQAKEALKMDGQNFGLKFKKSSRG